MKWWRKTEGLKFNHNILYNETSFEVECFSFSYRVVFAFSFSYYPICMLLMTFFGLTKGIATRSVLTPFIHTSCKLYTWICAELFTYLLLPTLITYSGPTCDFKFWLHQLQQKRTIFRSISPLSAFWTNPCSRGISPG